MSGSENDLRVVFIVFFVATILTLYEISLFFIQLTPQIKNQIDNNINKIKQPNPFSFIISSILESFKEREDKLINKINTYTFVTGIIIMIFLLLLLSITYYLIISNNFTLGKCTWIIILLTLLFIFAFQYSFYLYGNSYKYIGSHGNEELIANILDKNF